MSTWWPSSKPKASANAVEADEDASVWSNPFTRVASNASLAGSDHDSEPGASSWANPFRSASRDAAPASGGSGSGSGGGSGSGYSFSNQGGGNAVGAGSGSKWINVDSENLSFARGELTGENSEFKKWGIDLTRQQRIMGFLICVLTGFVISLLGTVLLILGMHTTFAILYAIGVVISLIGTGFLIGFARQVKLMFKPVRIFATGLMISAFVMVWVSAFVLKISFLALIFCILLYIFYLWYALSYIPGAHNFLKGIYSKIV